MLLLASFGCSETSSLELPAPDAGDLVASSEQAIVDGNTVAASANPGVAALYHKVICKAGMSCPTVGSPFWWPRPCSATILRWRSPAWILTSRHCVTQDGSVAGTPSAANTVAINTSISPGLIPPAGPPPAGSVFAAEIVTPYVPSGLTPTEAVEYDYALVRLGQALPEPARRVALGMDPTEDPNPLYVFAYGYGRYEFGDPVGWDDDGPLGAGTLRNTSGIDITAILDRRFSYDAMFGSIAHGDSGGPTFIYTNTSWFYRIMGLHALVGGAGCGDFECGWETLVPGFYSFLQTHVGSFYLSPGYTPDATLTVSGANGLALSVASADSWARRWKYGLGLIYATNGSTKYYLARSPSGPRVETTANLSTQWWVFKDASIRSPQNDPACSNAPMCLARGSSGNVVLECCSGTMSQRWGVHYNY